MPLRFALHDDDRSFIIKSMEQFAQQRKLSTTELGRLTEQMTQHLGVLHTAVTQQGTKPTQLEQQMAQQCLQFEVFTVTSSTLVNILDTKLYSMNSKLTEQLTGMA